MHNPRPQQHRMQQPERLAHPPQQQAQRPRRSMRAEAVPDSSQQELVAAALHHLPRNMHNLPAAASHAAAKTARSSTAAATAKAKALNASAGRARQLICELVAAA